MGSEFCEKWKKRHKNCVGCPYQEECMEKALKAIRTVEELMRILKPWLEEGIQ